MLAHDLHVLMVVPPVTLVLDAEIWETNLLVDVREVVIPRPCLNLSSVAIRSPVALRIALVVLLKPFLILTPQIDFQHDAFDVGALVA